MNARTLQQLTEMLKVLVQDDETWSWLKLLRDNNTVPPELPTPEPEPDIPDEKHPGYKSMTRKYTKDIYVNYATDGEKARQAAYIFPLYGKDLKSVIVEYSDGQPGFKVRDPSSWHIPFPRKYAKYQPKASDSKTGFIEVYAERGTKPETVTLYYK